jgi:hypothetical protein
MTFKDALTVYLMLAGAIWVMFLRTEALLKEDRIRSMYKIMLKRPTTQEQWPHYIEHFVDITFRFYKGSLRFVPAIPRVYVLTGIISSAAVCFSQRDQGFGHKLFFIFLVTACNAPFDVVSIAKTRFLIMCIGRTKARALRGVSLFLDLIGGMEELH